MIKTLEVEQLTKRFKEFEIHDINLSIEPGYIVGLLGVNGSGKTTLLNTILNLYTKDQGRVRVNGHDMESEERLAKDDIGFVLDHNLFEEHLSVLKNATYFGSFYKRYDEKLFKKFCEKFEVPLHQKVGKLSTGMKTRFQLAFALSHDARLYIMDEPAAGLDPVFRKDLVHYMQEIVEDGTRSVLFSTHITEDLEGVGDYILLMKDGSIVLNCSMEEYRERYLLISGNKEELEQMGFAKVIYQEIGDWKSTAILRRCDKEDYSGYITRVPKLEELMYALEKGGYEYV